METLPILTTKETEKLREDYPSIEHLEAGNTSNWLQERQDQLLIRAKNERAGMNLAKFITGGAVAVGAICYATSPLAPIGAAIAGLGYVWAVAQDLNDTHSFAPVPFIRGDFFKFLSAMGDSEEREEYFAGKNELTELMLHLELMEKYEFGMLKGSAHLLTEYLTQVAEGKRFYAYRWLLDWFIQLKGNFPSTEQLHGHLADVTVDPRINYEHVSAIQEVRSSVSIGIPPTRTASLPQTNTVALPQPSRNAPESAMPTLLNHTQKQVQNHHQVALNILDALVLPANEKSLGGCIIIAAPGAGKTTFLGTAWGRLRAKYGDNLQSLAVVVKKSDVSFFKQFATRAIAVKDDPVAAALSIIKFIDSGMIEGKITRIFLDDFLTMSRLLDNALKNVWLDPTSYATSDKKELGFVSLAGHLYATLNEAWLVGREYNLCLWVSSHSPNLEALPFCGSPGSRSVGDLIFLAKNNKREFIELALSNAFLISSGAKRSELKVLLDGLDSGSEPLILANHDNWTLGIVPDSIYGEYQGYREQCLQVADAPQNSMKTLIQSDDTRQQLERFLALPSAQPVNLPRLSVIASTILEIIKSGNPPVKFDAIRKSRKWGEEAPVTSAVKAGISELISLELIDGDNESGYVPTT